MAQRGKLLVVDDDADILESLAYCFKEQGFAVTACPDGRAALEQLSQNEFDVVVSDLRMPRVDGLTLLREVRARAPETEVIILTAHADLELAIQTLRSGAFDLVRKPFDFEVVQASVERALEQRRLKFEAVLSRATRAILAASDGPSLSRAIAELGPHAAPAEFVTLFLAGIEGELEWAHTVGERGEEVPRLAQLALAERIGRGAVVEALLLPASDARLEGVPGLEKLGAVAVQPLVGREELLGVMLLGRLAPARAFSLADLLRLELLSSLAQLALENAALTRRLLHAERLASMGRLSSSLGRSLSNPLTFAAGNIAFARARLASFWPELSDVAKRQLSHDEPGHALGEARSALSEAESGLGQIREVLRDLEILSRTDEQSSAVYELEEPLRSAARLSGLSEEVELDFTPGLRVRGSAGALSQAVMALLADATRTPVPPRGLKLRSLRDGSRVLLELVRSAPLAGARPLTREPGAQSYGELLLCQELVLRQGGSLQLQRTDGDVRYLIHLPSAD